MLSFGLISAFACFICLMEGVMIYHHWKTLLLYFDDITVFSENIDSHVQHDSPVGSRSKVEAPRM